MRMIKYLTLFIISILFTSCLFRKEPRNLYSFLNKQKEIWETKNCSFDCKLILKRDKEAITNIFLVGKDRRMFYSAESDTIDFKSDSLFSFKLKNFRYSKKNILDHPNTNIFSHPHRESGLPEALVLTILPKENEMSVRIARAFAFSKAEKCLLLKKDNISD